MENQETLIPKIAKCGLINIGNTCFMNSVLQVMIHNKLLFMFYIKINKNNEELLTNFDESIEFSPNGKGQYEDFLHEAGAQRLGDKIRRTKKLEKNDEVSINSSDHKKFMVNSFSSTFSELLNRIIYKGNSTYTPSDFRRVLSTKFSHFTPGRQHDSHELLTCILDEICEETGVESSLEITNSPEEVEKYIKYTKDIKREYGNAENSEEKEKILEKFKKFKLENSIMVKQHEYIQYKMSIHQPKYNLIIGKMRTFTLDKRKCNSCGADNFSFDSTNVLNIPINGDTLEDCLDYYIAERETNESKCKNCRKVCKMNITTNIVSASPVLYISLERFLKENLRYVKKNTKNIKIPEYLDITKYCDYIINKSNCKYKLKGIVNHYGMYGGGHYTAYCLDMIDEKTWYEFDDSRVSIIKDFEVDESSAYILLYESIL